MKGRTIILATITLITFSCDRHGGEAQPGPAVGSAEHPPPESNVVDKRDATVLAPVLDYALEDGRNVIWCASFQLAWNELRDVVIGSDITLQDGPDWVSILNRKTVTKDDLSPDAYVALVGRKKDNIVARINEELRRKFPPPVPELRLELDSNTIVAYAYLRKALRFMEKFDSCNEPMRFQSGTNAWNAACFGIAPSRSDSERFRAMSRQVSIVSYRDESDFVIMLTTEGNQDQIILAKTTPAQTLSATVDRVLVVVQKAKPFPLATHEPLWIPKVSFDLERSFEELIGKFLRNPGWEGLYIDVAMQHTQFDLDERGAMLSSEARIEIKSSEGRARFIFDRPFLILLRQVNRERPYFAAWIANGELLAKR